ncbi:dead end protein 1-like [Corythoichthys intestinalis]|uniref:dead end protein 1-like n=1 Tax=Corythoichthys intestinalis TaxID=161448 RepID=UPI0025A64866|nr:dead end protein 1-like [Corythoichthys intestinalis]
MHLRPQASHSAKHKKMESNKTQVLERVQALETWLKMTKTKITQVNGQRSSLGPLWDFRLMINFRWPNRGFANAKYSSTNVAKKVVGLLHGDVLAPGLRLIVWRSTERRCLCMTFLPTCAQEDELLQVLYGSTDGLEELSLTSENGMKDISAIVLFSSHYAASMAKRELVQAFWKQFGLSICVHWQSPKKARPDDRLPQKPQSGLTSTPNLGMIPSKVSIDLPPYQQSPLDFCRAVGAPAKPKPTSSQTPSALLQNCCALVGVGPPAYDFSCGPAGPDGSLRVTYMVRISGIGVFQGLVRVLPKLTATSTLAGAREAAAQEILQWIEVKKIIRLGRR